MQLRTPLFRQFPLMAVRADEQSAQLSCFTHGNIIFWVNCATKVGQLYENVTVRLQCCPPTPSCVFSVDVDVLLDKAEEVCPAGIMISWKVQRSYTGGGGGEDREGGYGGARKTKEAAR